MPLKNDACVANRIFAVLAVSFFHDLAAGGMPKQNAAYGPHGFGGRDSSGHGCRPAGVLFFFGNANDVLGIHRQRVMNKFHVIDLVSPDQRLRAGAFRTKAVAGTVMGQIGGTDADNFFVFKRGY